MMNKFKSDTEEIEEIGSGVDIPADILIQVPDGHHKDLSDRRVRGRARGPYDWHPDWRELEGR
eukprot:4957211-Heterocapsa_arctica.AAC.1